LVSQASIPAEVYPNVYQSGTGNSVLSQFGTRFVLPAGTVYEDKKVPRVILYIFMFSFPSFLLNV